jgi:predicted nuclease with RNAse H fold
MNVVGIDLSGPSNTADTYVTVFNPQGDQLRFTDAMDGANDEQILQTVSRYGQSERIIIGLDAPLSYNPGGGDRRSDRELRRLVHEKGGGAGVMPPTMIRMVYLTLRGVALTRMLETLRPTIDLQIVEVHPGATMVLRGAPAKDVTGFKREHASRLRLLAWLGSVGLQEIPRPETIPDHFVAACAAALGAWQWSLGRAIWCFHAKPPEHPYDFAC